MLNLPGFVKAISQFGIGFGLVELDEPYQGLKYAAIGLDTLGRFSLKRDEYGNLIIGTRVIVVDAEVGSEALRVIKIAKE